MFAFVIPVAHLDRVFELLGIAAIGACADADRPVWRFYGPIVDAAVFV